MKTLIDFETRSEVNIKKVGAYEYAVHPSTEVFCMAVKSFDETGYASPTVLWIPEKFQKISGIYVEKYTCGNVTEVWAHNAFFERVIWENIMVKRHGFPKIPIEKWRCSAALSRLHSLPGSLDGACSALGVTGGKDMDGHRVMLKMTKPRKPTKNDKSKWHEAPEDFKKLFNYCIRDVDATYKLIQRLDPWTENELKVWQIDQVINMRGFHVDRPTIKSALKKIEVFEAETLSNFPKLTDGAIKKPTQTIALKNWLNSDGLDIPNLAKDTLIEYLKKPDLKPQHLDILRARQLFARSSTKKYEALLKRSNSSGRVRDTFLFCGATRTGRWSGGFQNIPRGDFKKGVDTCIDLIREGETEDIELLFGNLMGALSTCLRGMICAPPGKKLFVADFSSIEGVVLAWLAGEEAVLDNYRKGLDPYCVFASQLYPQHTYDEIYEGYKANDEMYSKLRYFGKAGELLSGFGGGQAAIARKHPDIELKKRIWIINKWREQRPITVKYWDNCYRAAVLAITEKKVVTYRKNKWAMKGDFLIMQLPSGRALRYYKPWMQRKTVKYVDERGAKKTFKTWGIMFKGVKTGNWITLDTYGGKLAQGSTQGTAACLQREAIVNLEKANYPVILQTHDETGAEVDKSASLEKFIDVMTQRPTWAQDLPIKADGFECQRYRK